MQPGAWVELEELPRLASGKVDRRGLPEARGSGLEGEYQGPRGELEEVLSGIYGEVLGLERVSVEDSFFELGGHSLLAMQVVSRVRERLGVELGLRELFEGPSVRQLGRAVEEAMRAAAGVGLPELERVQRGGEQPLSYGQQRLWFLEQMEPGSPEYNVPLGLRLEGELGVEELRWALGEVVRRHEVLRTVFVNEGGRARQEVREWQGMELEEEDLREEGEEGARRMAEAEGLRGFDLERGPLLRARLLRLGERQWVLLLTLHHIVTDGWSVGVMWREVGELYGARRRGEEARLGELGLQYVDYAVWQRRWLEGEEMERQVRSWRERLEGWPQVLELGLGGERPGVKGWRGGVVGLGLGEEQSRGLRELGRRAGATLYMTLLGAWEVLLWRYSGQRRMLLGTPVAGRSQRALEGLVGFFVNTLVVRGEVRGEESFEEQLVRVGEEVVWALRHQEAPLEKPVEALGVERDLGRTPLFQVMFTFDTGGEEPAWREAGLEVRPLGGAVGTAKFDLTLTMTGGQRGGLRGGLNY